MATARQSWEELGSRLQALGMKLRYHVEEQRSEPEEDDPALQRLGEAIDDLADALEHAIDDPAVKSDVKDIFYHEIPDTLANTFHKLSTDLRKALDS